MVTWRFMVPWTGEIQQDHPPHLAIAPCRRRLPEKRQQWRFQVAAPWLQGQLENNPFLIGKSTNLLMAMWPIAILNYQTVYIFFYIIATPQKKESTYHHVCNL